MPKTHWLVTPLGRDHQRHSFDCGEPALNNYLMQLAGQHAKNNISRTFVAVSDVSVKLILGFYTLSAGNISFNNLPVKLQKKLPKYPVPIARIGRLATDKSSQGLGLGEYLLMDALQRCTSLSKEIGIIGVVVDAKHEKAKAFYLRYGFFELTDTPLTLFIPVQDVIASTI